MSYNDKLDADEQVSMEEKIAAVIFDSDLNLGDDPDLFDEEDCAELGRIILLMVLKKFRPDLFTCSWCDKPAISAGEDGTFSCGQGQGDGLGSHDNVGVLYTPLKGGG